MFPRRTFFFYLELLLFGCLLPFSFLYSLVVTGWMQGINDPAVLVPLPLLIFLFFISVSVWSGYLFGLRSRELNARGRTALDIGRHLAEKLEMEIRIDMESGKVVLSDAAFLGVYMVLIEQRGPRIHLSSCMTDARRRKQRVSLFGQHIPLNRKVSLELNELNM